MDLHKNVHHQPSLLKRQFAKLITAVFASIALLTACKSTEQPPQYTYEASATAYDDVVNAQKSALENGKLLLVVLGAQWCHDSTGLAKRFQTQEMQPILTSHYETIFVDVGLLEDRRAITQRFDYPTYYATPTVMIVDPASSALLNRASMAIWGRADSIALVDYVDYFTKFAQLSDKQKLPMMNWQVDPQVAAYDTQHAARLQKAYDLLGPLLQKDIAGEPPEGFYDLWKEVRGYRSDLQETMVKRAETQLEQNDNGKADAQVAPALRHYHPFSWESK